MRPVRLSSLSSTATTTGCPAETSRSAPSRASTALTSWDDHRTWEKKPARPVVPPSAPASWAMFSNGFGRPAVLRSGRRDRSPVAMSTRRPPAVHGQRGAVNEASRI